MLQDVRWFAMTAPDPPHELARALALLPVAAYVCDRDGRVTDHNERAARLWGRAPGAHERFTAVALFTRHGAALPPEATPAARAIDGGHEVAGIEIAFDTLGGGRVDALAYAAPLRDVAGTITGALCVMADVTVRASSGRAGDDLMAMVGHDLRNCLAPIRNAAQILRGHAAADARTAWAVDLIERQVAEIVGVIETAAEASRLARGAVKVWHAPYDVARVVEAAVTAARPALTQGDQLCEVTLDLRDARAEGDAARAEQAVLALLRSASRSLPTGAAIAVDVRADADRIAIAIDARVAMNPATARRASQDSLPLVLARGLAELLGGTLAVDGTRYELSLPRRAP